MTVEELVRHLATAEPEDAQAGRLLDIYITDLRGRLCRITFLCPEPRHPAYLPIVRTAVGSLRLVEPLPGGQALPEP